MAKAIEGPVSFLRSSNFLRTWSPQQGQVCELANVALSHSRPPPTMAHAAVKDVPDRPRHQLAAGKGWLGYPVVQGDVHGKDGVLYPVTNMDDRDWRQRHRQGGDFMIYTDRLTVRLASPIRVFL